MYLKSLELSGFKSFAKKSVLNFTSPISAIVGPNGSGKSNVAEAFRFVLGEQSIKSMRGKRGEDLIFNGGSEGARTNRASVKVVFDNRKRILNIDFDEVTIERVVHRDNSNEYFINSSPTRLRDIVELLAGAYIGASGHHIISQGEADRILNANIRERREMIEDALGLKIYQYKKAESQRKLEKTEENMKSVESLRREIAPHLKFLKKQVEKVEKVQELREELRKLYREYLKREETYLKAQRSKIESDKHPIAKELNKLEREMIEAKDLKNHNPQNENIDGFKTVYLRDVEEIFKKIDILESISEIKKIISNFISFHKNRNYVAVTEIENKLIDLRNRNEGLEKSLKETKIIARKNELQGLLNSIKINEDKLIFEEEAFKRELNEAYVLVGREIMEYKDFIIVGTTEDRTAQYSRQKSIEKIKIRIEDSGAGNSVDILKEHKEVEDRDAFLARELDDLEASKKSLHDLIAELDARIDVEFKEGILKINVQFQNYFSLMFGGGTAGLSVIREKRKKKRPDSELPLDNEEIIEEEESEEGIDINVNLPRRKVKGLMMLSGGERALTSIALLFAVSQVNPPPFIILDETDAALDEANSKKYGDMISNLSEYSQLILITHNRETMSRAGVLYGVTMGSDGASKLLSIQFDEAVTVAK